MITLTKEQFERIEKLLDGSYKIFGNGAGEEFYDALKALPERIEKLEAAQKQLADKIRSSRAGYYVPGMEDEAKSFNLLRACVGIMRSGTDQIRRSVFAHPDLDAEREFELLKAIQDKHGDKIYRNRCGGVAAQFKTQAVGNDELGGAFIPDQLIADVIAAIYTASVWISMEGSLGETRVRLLDGLTGGSVTIPKFNGGSIAYWTHETQNTPKSTATTDEITMTPRRLSTLLQLTEAMRRLASPALDAMFREDMVRAMVKKLDWTVMYGTGGGAGQENGMPRGIVNTLGIKIYSAQSGGSDTLTQGLDLTAAPFQASWSGGELDFTGLSNMSLVLFEDDIVPEGENFTTVSSHRYFHRLKNLRIENYSGQTSGQPYLLGMPMMSDARLRDLIGDFGRSTQISAFQLPGINFGVDVSSGEQDFTDVFHGNMREIVLGRWGGIDVMSDDGKGELFRSGGEQVRTVGYFDINIRQPRAIIVCPDARAQD